MWTILLVITVIYQRRKKEAGKMKEKWEEMKRVDGDRIIGEAT